MKTLITGISGFAGGYLSEYLAENKDYEIHGISLKGDSSSLPPLIRDRVKIHQANLLDSQKVEDIISEIKPDFIYHLAALSSPRKSFDEPQITISNNVNSEISILEAVKNLNLKETRILIVSSADIYGTVSEKYLPINEETPLNPTNPYSVSKITQDFLGLMYSNAFGTKVIRVRPFNHTGPKQTDLFVIPAFCRRIVAAKKDGTNIIKVGNLKAKRDFTDVRDMVRAYVLAIEKGLAGEVYNLGSGVSYSMEEIVDKLIAYAGGGVKKEVDKSLFLPADNPNLVCDYSKFSELTRWKPEISLDKTLKDTLDYWRNLI